MTLLNILDTTLPITDPVLKYLITIVIVLLAPIILNKLKIPHLIGLIIAGALIGPNGFGILDRDSSIVVSGTTGLLYIMFLAGLEIDLVEFKKNKWKSLTFGLFTFAFPMVVGTSAAYYVLHYPLMTSVLIGSLIASHTLLAYPILSKLGAGKDKSVNIAVGGTMITDTLALLVLAAIVGMSKGTVDAAFWLRLSISIVAFGLVVLLGFPIIARWFFKRISDKISQFIFVLVMVYLGAVLAEIAGVEAIIGAFLAGLALNRLIPHTSPLMNRVEFVGNALFIPFFLISVGMLIDFRAFVKNTETILVALVLTIAVILAKYLAAWATSKTFKLTKDQLNVIFSLSIAQAAATLATVMVGYNIIIAETPNGEPIRLLSESVLNGSILVILITCTISSLVAQKSGKKVADALDASDKSSGKEASSGDKILIASNSVEHTDELVQLALNIMPNKSATLHALHIINKHDAPDESDRKGKKILEAAVQTGAAADVPIKEILRFDNNIINGISGEVKANKITDLILGYSRTPYSSAKNKNFIAGLLNNEQQTTFVYNSQQPISTIKRNIIVVPKGAEKEIGFNTWMKRLWSLAKSSGSSIKLFGTQDIKPFIKVMNEKNAVEVHFEEFYYWEDILIISREIGKNDLITFVLSRQGKHSYHHAMGKIYTYLDKYFRNVNFLLVYPAQYKAEEADDFFIKDNTFLNPTVDIQSIGKEIGSIFTRAKE